MLTQLTEERTRVLLSRSCVAIHSGLEIPLAVGACLDGVNALGS
jgi:hypothetical protein